MLYNLKDIKGVEVKGKKVFLRADVDVPIANGKIADDTRLKAWLPTFEYLLTNGARVFIGGHMGRPKFQSPKENEEFSLKPVAEWLKNQLELHHELKELNLQGLKAWEITEDVFLLENLRFYKEEEENDEEFSKKLASLGEIYVNDAFASSHRVHASIVGITKYLPSFAGLRLLKEVEELSLVLENPKRPLTVMIGGAKIETKLPLVKKMHSFADFVLVGGELSEQDKVLLRVMHEEVDKIKSILLVADLSESRKEITEYSTENFIQIINKSVTVVWNGPMGLVEEEEFAKETRKLARAIAHSSAYTIVGGGDTVAFLQKEKLLDKFSFVSTGGGAMLEFLSGEKLPGLTALEK